MKTRYTDIQPYITRDGSEIRELMHPSIHHALGVKNQSLAEATVWPGETTVLHRHHVSEEIYAVIEGVGRMRLGEDWFAIAAGDTVCIPPGTPHQVKNTGETKLVMLCCCAPAYRHDDTELLEEVSDG